MLTGQLNSARLFASHSARHFERGDHLSVADRPRPRGYREAMRLAAARIFVRDLEAAADFYVGGLGLTVRAGGPADGWLVVDVGSCDLVVEQVPPDAPDDDLALVGRFTGLSLRVPDVAGEYRTLSARGVRFDGAPAPQSWGGVLATLVDPSGNRVQLVQYPTEVGEPDELDRIPD